MNHHQLASSAPHTPAFSALVEELKSWRRVGPDELRSLFPALQIGVDDVAFAIDEADPLYGRVPIVRTPDFEAFILTWLPGRMTPMHDHRGSACGVRVLRGEITEISYRRSPCGVIAPEATTRVGEGKVVVSWDEDMHQMGNLETGRSAVTLHCYSPPLRQMSWYTLDQTVCAAHDERVVAARNRCKS